MRDFAACRAPGATDREPAVRSCKAHRQRHDTALLVTAIIWTGWSRELLTRPPSRPLRVVRFEAPRPPAPRIPSPPEPPPLVRRLARPPRETRAAQGHRAPNRRRSCVCAALRCPPLPSPADLVAPPNRARPAKPVRRTPAHASPFSTPGVATRKHSRATLQRPSAPLVLSSPPLLALLTPSQRNVYSPTQGAPPPPPTPHRARRVCLSVATTRRATALGRRSLRLVAAFPRPAQTYDAFSLDISAALVFTSTPLPTATHPRILHSPALRSRKWRAPWPPPMARSSARRSNTRNRKACRPSPASPTVCRPHSEFPRTTSCRLNRRATLARGRSRTASVSPIFHCSSPNSNSLRALRFSISSAGHVWRAQSTVGMTVSSLLPLMSYRRCTALP